MIADRIDEQRADPHTAPPSRASATGVAHRLARQALLERYLLGRLDEGARAVLRASAIANPHVFAEVRETELDLLDALAGGTLDGDRARVVRASLTFGNHDSWPVSQALAEHATRRTHVAPRVLPFPLVEPVGARSPRPFSSQLQVWPAAAMILLAAGLWFARNPGAPFVGPPIAPSGAITTRASASMPDVTLHVSVDTSGAPPRRLRLAPGASPLRIEVALPSDMPSPVDIAVNDADGRVLWAVRRLATGPSIVTVSIPADSLARGLLSLVVTPSDGSRPARRTSFFLE